MHYEDGVKNMNARYETILSAYKAFLPCEWEPATVQIDVLNNLIDYAMNHGFVIGNDYEGVFVEAVNQKLALNLHSYKNILDVAFAEKIKLNYIVKTRIKKLLDRCDKKGYLNLLSQNNIFSKKMISAFIPVNKETTLYAANKIYSLEEKWKEVYSSIFSRFCFNLFPELCCYIYFSCDNQISDDYFLFISNKYPDLVDRTKALYILDVSQEIFIDGYYSGCNTILSAVKSAYRELNNYCEIALYIPSLTIDGIDIQWRLYSDIILYSEKHIKEKIDRAYFRWKIIGDITLDYISGLNAYNAEFEYAFQGFVYKDCFILGNDVKSYSILLLLEKNQRDERVVNCPVCRTKNVQGNSYPILNVRSWECENPLCPERSKYNRGKRYSFVSLFRQKEMLNDINLIPQDSISRWRLDCLQSSSKEDAIDMVIRHYSCHEDSVIIVSNSQCNVKNPNGRNIVNKNFEKSKFDLLASFKSSAYFYRYLQHNDKTNGDFICWKHLRSNVYLGDSLDVLRSFSDDVISCAVTSPPYYNAKSYSQWPNIYCYLYDMYNINTEVFRVLKNGGVYLYNIFDYFDNENNISLSAMGNKRMILGAYMIDMFERIGFTVCGNIIWNKGDVQGNRCFNQGNLTPYYQSPLNCWEHILILSKGCIDKKFSKLTSRIVDMRPVVKYIKGKNVLGHDAPFPQGIPQMLVECMSVEDVILDPFLGSGTTCVVANKYNRSSIGIEKNEQYFELCKSLIGYSSRQLDMFN